MGKQLIFAILVLTTLFMTACASDMAQPKPTLYERLGGKEAIKMVINDFIDSSAATRGSRIRKSPIVWRVSM